MEKIQMTEEQADELIFMCMSLSDTIQSDWFKKNMLNHGYIKIKPAEVDNAKTLYDTYLNSCGEYHMDFIHNLIETQRKAIEYLESKHENRI